MNMAAQDREGFLYAALFLLLIHIVSKMGKYIYKK